ncbi:CdaR family protein [Tepidibacillus fermentans]|uniref:YbbR domain-containing protein n=1 Tax=Tepidibacillus fermentans TaxID=1281767 RepID=A0A4R3K706_9BACI|nr:CdaR family protein [Tepidibacillus fermentans]TCS78640.1 YbbR domain-containing protein [Tepidibacillus fermentans]
MDNWLKNNNVLKALSLIIAIMLWLVVNMEQTANPSLTPIDQRENAYIYEANVIPKYNEEQYVVDVLTKRVTVTLKSNTRTIGEIQDGKMIDKGQFFVDLTSYKKGTFDVPIQYTGFPRGIDIDIQPRTLKVKIEEKHRIEMPILVDQLGKAAEGFQTGDAIVTPSKVHISGTKEEVESVAFVKAFINVENANKMITEQVPLHALDKKGNPVKVEITPQTAEVKIPVTSPYQMVPLTYKIIDQPKAGLAIQSIDLKTKDVTLYGPEEIVSKYEVYQGPNVSVANLPIGKNSIQLKIPVASGLYKTEPDQIQLEITIVKSEKKDFKNIGIDLNGLSKGLKGIIISPTTINLTLEGAPDILRSTRNDDIQAFVDLTNLPPGEHEVELQYNVPLYTKVINTKEKVKVRIVKE